MDERPGNGKKRVSLKSEAHLLVYEGHAQQTPYAYAGPCVSSELNRKKQGLFLLGFVFKTFQRMKRLPGEDGQSSPTGRVRAACELDPLRKGCWTWLTPWRRTVLGGKKLLEQKVLEYILNPGQT